MKNVREGFFETNSSSTHSISISNGGKDKLSDSLTVEDGVCKIYPGEFGWGVEVYKDAAMKASYCLTYVKQDHDGCEEMLKDVIREFTGAKQVKFIGSSSEYYEWGYIDHQSYDVGDEIFLSKDNLRNFIFNPKSILVIDNDNH